MAPVDEREDWKWERTGEAAWAVPSEAVEVASSDEDEDGFSKLKLGSGHWGIGSFLMSCLIGKQKLFTDGFGLCSPGRWPPAQRQSAEVRRE